MTAYSLMVLDNQTLNLKVNLIYGTIKVHV